MCICLSLSLTLCTVWCAQIEKEQKQKMALEMKKKSEAVGLKIDLAELESLDADTLVARQVEQLEAEKKELRTRLTTLGRRLDHTERALRKEELPLFAADYDRQKQEDRAYHETQTAAARRAAEEQHQRDAAVRARLLRMVDDARRMREVRACMHAHMRA
jgi:translation initiation factor 3 subunit A